MRIVFSFGFNGVADFSGRAEIKISMLENFTGHVIEKSKNARAFPLVLAESFIIHKEINHFAIARYLVGPACKFIGSERKLRPSPVRKTKRNIIGETIVL